MRDHEVPTHVQTQDRVFLGLTFPQIGAIVGVLAFGYAIWRFLPIPSFSVRIGIAAVFVLIGAIGVVVSIKGRGLPLVVADLLKYHLGPRHFFGPLEDLVRSEPPPAPPPKPNPVTNLTARVKLPAALRRQQQELQPFPDELAYPDMLNEDMLNEDMLNEPEDEPPDQHDTGHSTRRGILALLLLALTFAALPYAVSADGPMHGESWQLGELNYIPTDPVPGRRLYLQGVSITPGFADATLRAATDLRMDAGAYAYDGEPVLTRVFAREASLAQDQTVTITGMPLDGPNPTLSFSWVDSQNNIGSVTLNPEDLPYPLPTLETRYCRFAVTSLSWKPGQIRGTVTPDCPQSQHPSSVITHTGEQDQSLATVIVNYKVQDKQGMLGGILKVRTLPDTPPAAFPLSTQRDTDFVVTVPRDMAVLPVELDFGVDPQLIAVSTHQMRNHEYVPEDVQNYNRTACAQNQNGDRVCRSFTFTVTRPAHINPTDLSPSGYTPPADGGGQLATQIYADAPYQAFAFLLADEEAALPFEWPEGMTLAEYLWSIRAR